MICWYSCSVNARQVSEVMLPFDVTDRSTLPTAPSSGASQIVIHVIATGDHIKILHLHSDCLEALAGGIESGRTLFDALEPWGVHLRRAM